MARMNGQMLLYNFFLMNIFVAKLSYDTTDHTVRDAFESFGQVDEVKLIFDRDTGRSKGYGFVEMPNDGEGLAAIEELNDSELDGRQIVVKKSEPRPQRDSRGGGGRQQRRW